MKITVAICTWNRCRLLAQTLDSFRQLQLDSIVDWEVLVVDNGSQDDTQAVAESRAKHLPLRYLLQPIPGHTRSRNFAVQHATGDLIVWTDDDVQVDPNWLNAYAAGASQYPQASFFGGPIEPKFECDQPDWLVETWAKCCSAFAARDQGAQELPIPPALFPFGANFAVRAAAQKQFLFDISLGRQGRGMLGEDETDLMQRLVRAGHRGIWLPAARLQHVMPAERATPQYVGRYFVGQGMANAIKHKHTFDSRSQALRIAVHNRLCYWLKKYRSPADEWVSHLICSSIAWGEFRAWNRDTQIKQIDTLNSENPQP